MAKRKSGKRTSSGRLSRAAPVKAWDYGNEVVQARRALFDHPSIQGGKAADQVSDGIGQLWALDMLDGYGIDPVALRDKGREYAELWWGYYPGAPSIANYDQRSRTSQSKEVPPATPRDLYFAHIDQCLAVGSHERRALFQLLINTAQGDEVEPWAARLIGLGLMERGRIRFANCAVTGDTANLRAAIRGLVALAGGIVQVRAAA